MAPDINGTIGASFNVTLSAGTLTKAYLWAPDQTKTDLTNSISNNFREVTIPPLPVGESKLEVAFGQWLQGGPDAIVDVGSVTQGVATASDPKPRIDNGSYFAFITLCGAVVQT
jgi:hypothetical protein